MNNKMTHSAKMQRFPSSCTPSAYQYGKHHTVLKNDAPKNKDGVLVNQQFNGYQYDGVLAQDGRYTIDRVWSGKPKQQYHVYFASSNIAICRTYRSAVKFANNHYLKRMKAIK